MIFTEHQVEQLRLNFNKKKGMLKFLKNISIASTREFSKKLDGLSAMFQNTKGGTILNGLIHGGEYYPQSGQIVVTDKSLAISYPHEKLHWLSRHKRRIYKIFSGSFEKVFTGVRVELPRTQEASLTWLSEAIISETTQHILAHSGEVRTPSISYSDDKQGLINRYVAGWKDARTRRVGDWFKRQEYSTLYGEPFRALVIKMGEFLQTARGRELYMTLRNKHNLPLYSRTASHENCCEVAVKIFQIGEFGIDNSIMFKMLNEMLGRGNLKRFVQISKKYDTLANLKLHKDKKLDHDQLIDLKSQLLKLIEN